MVSYSCLSKRRRAFFLETESWVGDYIYTHLNNWTNEDYVGIADPSVLGHTGDLDTMVMSHDPKIELATKGEVALKYEYK